MPSSAAASRVIRALAHDAEMSRVACLITIKARRESVLQCSFAWYMRFEIRLQRARARHLTATQMTECLT